jgi:hypothetical protein
MAEKRTIMAIPDRYQEAAVEELVKGITQEAMVPGEWWLFPGLRCLLLKADPLPYQLV